jgi:hypothetical protein
MKKSKASRIAEVSPPDLPNSESLEQSAISQLSTGETYSDLLFQNNDWSGQQGSGISLNSVFLRSVNLSKTRLRSIRMRDVSMTNCDLSVADWGGAVVQRAELSTSRLSGFNSAEGQYGNVVFRGCILSYAIFQFASFDRCLFEDCDMVDATFQAATLNHVTFKNCNLTNAQFTDARVSDIDFRGSRIEGLAISLDGLRGVTIDPTQTQTVALLTGVKIRPLLDPV